MKINSKLLSIPPFISTCWSNVTALHMKSSILVIGLIDGDCVEIPGLKHDIIEKIFNTHASVLEQGHFSHSVPLAAPLPKMPPFSQTLANHPENISDSPFRLTFASMDELGSVMHHNPHQAQAPDLPPEILQKIAAITKIISPEDPQMLPKAEPHCNCMHCQIARVVHQSNGTAESAIATAIEEEVKPEELNFQQWEISQISSNLYSVANRLDQKEKYSVYLGNPVGCTCGKAGCEHIIAVLKS